jgi:hypothetical protein
MGTGVRTAGTQRVTIATDDTVNIGSIGGAITPGTGSNNLGKPVDGAAGAGDVGVLALAVRDDALTTLTPADDDYTQLRVTSQGRLWTSAVIDTALPAGTNNIGDVDVASLPGTVATDITAIKTAVETLDNAVSGNEFQVDIVASLPAGTNNIGDVDVASLPGTVASDITAIKTAVEILDNTVSGNELQVDIVASLPAGTNNIGDVDVASLPGTVASDITAIKTAVEILDNTVSGNELQVDIVASLPAGTNSIGNVNTISAVTTVSTVTNLSQLGGTAISMGTGTRDAGTQRVTIATNDVVPISDNSGSLTVDAPVGTPVFVRLSDGSAAITNLATNLAQVGGTTTVTGGTNGTLAIGGVQAHDAVASGNKPVLIGGVANTSSPPAVSSGDVSQLWTTTTGALNVADGGSSLSIDDSGGSLTVDAPVGTPVFVRLSDGSAAITTLPVSLASLPSLAAGTNSIGDVNTVSAVTTVSTVTNLSQLGGTAIAMGSGTRSAGTQRVTIATDDSVPVTGTFWQATQPVSLALAKAEDAASADADSLLPIAAVRQDTIAASTSADGDYTWLKTNNVGRLYASAAIDTALPAGTNNIGDVDVASLPGTVAADITAIKTAVETLDNAVSGNEFQVDIVASLPAGTNSIGNVNTISAVTTVSTVSTVTNLSQLGGTAIAMGTGVRTAGTQRVTIATDDVVPISDNSGSLTVDAPVGTPVFVRLSDGSSAITNLATNLAQVGGTTTVTGGTAGSQGIGGIQAHDAAVSGNNPVLTGGVANNSVPTAVAAGDVSRHWTNLNGAMATAAYPENISAFAPTNASSTALASSLVVKATAGTLYMITGYSARASAQFIHVYNAASLPSDGGVPVMVFTVPAQSNFSLDLGIYGRHFTTGIVIGNSTTAATKTIGSSDCWFDVQYK